MPDSPKALAAALLLVAMHASEQCAAEAAFPAKLGPIALGQSRTSVETSLGKPRTTIRTGDVLDPELKYRGLTIWITHDSRVGGIRSTSPGYCTTDGICPGMPMAAAKKRVGMTRSGKSLTDGSNEYAVTAEACWLAIAVAKSAVVSLELKCQP